MKGNGAAQHGTHGVVRLESVAGGCAGAEVTQTARPIIATLALSLEWFRTGKGEVREQCARRLRVSQVS